jgi:hypothetical protein
MRELTPIEISIVTGRVCPYCKSIPQLVDATVVYGQGTNYGKLWLCPNRKCMAYVGVHKKTNEPLGRLADAGLRAWKKKAHAAFDVLWNASTAPFTRNEAYEWLQEPLDLPAEYCHIGMFSPKTCSRVVDLCTELLNQYQ